MQDVIQEGKGGMSPSNLNFSPNSFLPFGIRQALKTIWPSPLLVLEWAGVSTSQVLLKINLTDNVKKNRDIRGGASRGGEINGGCFPFNINSIWRHPGVYTHNN